MTSNPNNIVLSYHAAAIYDEDVETLYPNEWLNDNILTLWIEHILHDILNSETDGSMENSSEKPPTNLIHNTNNNTAILPSSALQSSDIVRLNDHIVILHPSAVQLSLQLSIDDYAEAMENLRLPTYSIILCPINNSTNPYEVQSGSHWSLLIAIRNSSDTDTLSSSISRTTSSSSQSNPTNGYGGSLNLKYLFIGIDSTVSLPDTLSVFPSLSSLPLSSLSSSSLPEGFTVPFYPSLRFYNPLHDSKPSSTNIRNTGSVGGNYRSTLRYIPYLQRLLNLSPELNTVHHSSLLKTMDNDSSSSFSFSDSSSILSSSSVFGYVSSPSQTNTYDCGIHVLYTIERISQQLCNVKNDIMQRTKLSSKTTNDGYSPVIPLSLNVSAWLELLRFETLLSAATVRTDIGNYRKVILQWIQRQQEQQQQR